MKRLYYTLFALSGVNICFAQPDVDGIGGIYYNLDKTTKTAEVTFRNIMEGDDDYLYQEHNQYKYKGDVSVPETVEYEGDTYTVNRLGENCFCLCSEIVTLRLPRTIASIGNSALSSLKSLELLEMEEGEKYYATNSIIYEKNGGGVSAIYCAPNIANGTITFDSKTTTLNQGLFNNNSGVRHIVFPSGITTLPDGVCNGCTNLQSIDLPEGLTSIGVSAFKNCSGLSEVTLPSSLKEIGKTAFENCGLKHVYSNADSELANIGGYAFAYCDKLSDFTITGKVKSIGTNAFSGCTSLGEIYNNSELKIEIGSKEYGCVAENAYIIYGKSDLPIPTVNKATVCEGDSISSETIGSLAQATNDEYNLFWYADIFDAAEGNENYLDPIPNFSGYIFEKNEYDSQRSFSLYVIQRDGTLKSNPARVDITVIRNPKLNVEKDEVIKSCEELTFDEKYWWNPTLADSVSITQNETSPNIKIVQGFIQIPGTDKICSSEPTEVATEMQTLEIVADTIMNEDSSVEVTFTAYHYPEDENPIYVEFEHPIYEDGIECFDIESGEWKTITTRSLSEDISKKYEITIFAETEYCLSQLVLSVEPKDNPATKISISSSEQNSGTMKFMNRQGKFWITKNGKRIF